MNSPWSRRAFLTTACAGAGLSALTLLASCRRALNEDSSGESATRFRDLTGEEVVLPRPARRIVDLYTVGTAFAIAAHGSPARIVAVNNIAHLLFKRGLIGRFYPETLDIPGDFSINGAPSIERLVSLNPDLVVDFKQSARNNAALMKSAGLTVAFYAEARTGVRNTIAALLLMYGQMIGDTARAERIITIMDETRARLDAIQSVPQPARPKVLLLSPIGERLHASGGGPGGLFSDSIYAAGGVNAAASLAGLIATGAEQIAAWNPDVILLFQSEDTNPSMIYDHPILGGGKAARERRVYVLPIGTNNWGSMGPDEYLCSIWLAELLHPDRMGRTLRDDMRRGFAAILGRTLSDTELDGILRLDLNADAAGYARFSRA